MLIALPDDLVNNSETLEFEIPATVAGQVRLYMDRFRLRLVPGVNVHLFPGENGPDRLESPGLKITRHLMRRIVPNCSSTATPCNGRSSGICSRIDLKGDIEGIYEVSVIAAQQKPATGFRGGLEQLKLVAEARSHRGFSWKTNV